MRPCPECEVEINENAILCWICDAVINRDDFRQCEQCRRWIRLAARVCRFCLNDSDRLSTQYAQKLRDIAPASEIDGASISKLLTEFKHQKDFESISTDQTHDLLEALGSAVCAVTSCIQTAHRQLAEDTHATVRYQELERLLATTCREIMRLIRLAPVDQRSIKQLTYIGVRYITTKQSARRFTSAEERATFSATVRIAKQRRFPGIVIAETLSYLAGSDSQSEDDSSYYTHVNEALQVVDSDSMSESADIEPYLRVAVDAALRQKLFVQAEQLSLRYLRLLEVASEPFWGRPHPNAEQNWRSYISAAFLKLAESQEGLGKYEQAIASYKRAIDEFEQIFGTIGAMASALVPIGRCFAQLGDDARAEEHFLLADDLNSGVARGKAKLELAVLHWKKGDMARVRSLAADIREMAQQDNPGLGKCHNVEIAELNSQFARLLIDSEFLMEAQEGLVIALAVRKSALLTFGRSKQHRRYLCETWRALADDQNMLADIAEKRQDIRSADRLRSQSTIIGDNNFDPQSFRYLIPDIFAADPDAENETE